MRHHRRILLCSTLLSAAIAMIAPSAHAQSAADDLKARAKRITAPLTDDKDDRLQLVATFPSQVTGVTVSEDNRIFVNFPRWTEDVAISVAELLPDGSLKAYPDENWNGWRNERMATVTPNDHFVCVQSVVADGRGSLWIVDPAAPNSEKTVKDGPKLVQVDLKTNSVKRVYPIKDDVAGPASYLNDIRISPDGRFGYMTDSGNPGGLVIVDLGSGNAWRALSGHPSTEMEKDVTVLADGKAVRRPDGRQPMFNADGIALSADGATLYWQALTGQTLYKIGTDQLQKPGATDLQPQLVAKTEPVDGLWMDSGNRLYLSSIASNSVKVLGEGNVLREVIKDSRLRWPDTFSQGPDGMIYITASHIQDSPWFHPTGWVDRRFSLFKFDPSSSETVGGGKK